MWQHAKLGDVCKWVKDSWENISDEIIIQSFKTYKISNEIIDVNFDKENDDDDLEITDYSEDDDSNGELSIDMKFPQAR